MEITGSEQRAALDEQIDAACDASGPHDDESFGDAGVAASCEALADLPAPVDGSGHAPL